MSPAEGPGTEDLLEVSYVAPNGPLTVPWDYSISMLRAATGKTVWTISSQAPAALTVFWNMGFSPRPGGWYVWYDTMTLLGAGFVEDGYFLVPASGAQVAHVQAFDIDGGPFWPSILPVANYDGHGSLAAVTVSYLAGVTQMTLETVPGGAIVWTDRTVPEDATLVNPPETFVWLSVSNLAGDPEPDIVVEDKGSFSVQVIKASDGATLWSRRFPAGTANLALGVGGGDAQHGEGIVAFYNDGSQASVSRVAGRTGQDVWGPVALFATGSGRTLSSYGANLAGDGGYDPVASETYTVNGVTKPLQTVAVSFASGASLWRDSNDIPTVLGDLNGGGYDVLGDIDVTNFGIDLKLLSGRDLSPLGQVRIAGASPPYQVEAVAHFSPRSPKSLLIRAASGLYLVDTQGVVWQGA